MSDFGDTLFFSWRFAFDLSDVVRPSFEANPHDLKIAGGCARRTTFDKTLRGPATFGNFISRLNPILKALITADQCAQYSLRDNLFFYIDFF